MRYKLWKCRNKVVRVVFMINLGSGESLKGLGFGSVDISINLSHKLSPEMRPVIVCFPRLTDWLTDTCISKDMPAASACVCVWVQPWPPLYHFPLSLLPLGTQHTSEAEKVKVTSPAFPPVSASAPWRWLSFLEQPAIVICVRVWLENRRLNEPG